MRTLMSAPPTDRVGRYPKHTFQVNSWPFTAQPFMLARVLPGETLTNLFMETRVVSDPILNSIIGWKQEYYFFYVKMTDLVLDAAKEMFVDPTNQEIAGHDIAANSLHTYAAKGAIDWTRKCLDQIVQHYFRDDGETVSAYQTPDGRPIVQIRENTFLDSLTDKDDMPEGAAISTATDAGDLDRLMDAFEQLRAIGLSEMTYEDWLRSNGIAVPDKDENKPELLTRFSDFQYPSNTINPVDGSAASAVSWVFRNGLGQKRKFFFKEPGFLMGVTVTRPKVYFGGLAGSAVGFAQRAWDWMPNYMRAMPETALKRFEADTGPLGDRTVPTDAYFLDMRDDLIHGDQFHNIGAFDAGLVGNGAAHLVPLPATNLNWKYPTASMIKSFFVDQAATEVRQDGYCSLAVKGFEVDYTVGNFAEA